jgi:hypothetical protein
MAPLIPPVARRRRLVSVILPHYNQLQRFFWTLIDADFQDLWITDYR